MLVTVATIITQHVRCCSFWGVLKQTHGKQPTEKIDKVQLTRLSMSYCSYTESIFVLTQPLLHIKDVVMHHQVYGTLSVTPCCPANQHFTAHKGPIIGPKWVLEKLCQTHGCLLLSDFQWRETEFPMTLFCISFSINHQRAAKLHDI